MFLFSKLILFAFYNREWGTEDFFVRLFDLPASKMQLSQSQNVLDLEFYTFGFV